MNPKLMNALVLAYIGDAVLEVRVRDYLVLEKHVAKPHDLQRAAERYVSAKAQASFIRICKDKNWLNEDEWSCYRRGRNTKGRMRVKNMTVQTHNESTGFEALLGTLHLLKQEKRLDELLCLYFRFIEGESQRKETVG